MYWSWREAINLNRKSTTGEMLLSSKKRKPSLNKTAHKILTASLVSGKETSTYPAGAEERFFFVMNQTLLFSTKKYSPNRENTMDRFGNVHYHTQSHTWFYTLSYGLIQ